MLKKIILVTCCTMILTFNFTLSYAQASTAAAKFEEFAAASYAAVVTGTMTIATGAMHTEEYLRDNLTELYETAKATYPKLSADMKANFLSSLNQTADGVIALGDWITAALDTYKSSSTLNPSPVVELPSGLYTSVEWNGLSLNGSFLYIYDRWDRQLDVKGTLNFGITTTSTSICLNFQNGSLCESENAKTIEALIKSFKASPNVYDYVSAVVLAGGKTKFSIKGQTISWSPTAPPSSYSKLDQWLRDVAIPNGNLGVYTPAEAWTKGDGVPKRLGLDATGQNLLTLPDGIPWQGDYGYVIPQTQLIDGVPAVLDTTVADWVGIKDRAKIRDATAEDIAQALDVDLTTAQQILEKIKNQGQEETTSGSLKNPSKKIVWTPLIMNAAAMTTKFPFSLPWDLIKQLKIFDVSPQSPKIEINVPEYLQIESLSIPLQFTLDLAMFDKVALVVRWFNIIIWDIALILILRKLLPE